MADYEQVLARNVKKIGDFKVETVFYLKLAKKFTTDLWLEGVFQATIWHIQRLGYPDQVYPVHKAWQQQSQPKVWKWKLKRRRGKIKNNPGVHSIWSQIIILAKQELVFVRDKLKLGNIHK